MNYTVSDIEFNDIDNTATWAANAMNWAVANGIISGIGKNTLAPANYSTRAQVAVIIKGFCDKVLEK